MSLDDLYRRIQRMDELEAKYNKLYEQFESKLRKDLPDTVFKFLPDYAEQKDKLEEKVIEVVDKYIREVWETYNLVYSRQKNQDEPRNLNPIPKPQSLEEATEELEGKLINIHEDRQHYCDLFWELYEKKRQKELFLSSIYKKMKEALTTSYFDDILTLDGCYLREFDSDVYNCAYWFIEAIYSIKVE